MYDPKTHEAVAAHLVVTTPLDKLLDRARETFQDLSCVKVFATGVSPEADHPVSKQTGQEGASKRYQEEVVAGLKTAGISVEAMDLRFNPNPNVGVNLIFDTRTGEMTVETIK